jgi:hypothetical protein
MLVINKLIYDLFQKSEIRSGMMDMAQREGKPESPIAHSLGFQMV